MRASGSNVKVFDYFAQGLPVLSTSIGIRGVDAVDGEHCLLARLEDFAEILGAWRERQAGWLRIPLFYNISLVIDFEGSSSGN